MKKLTSLGIAELKKLASNLETILQFLNQLARSVQALNSPITRVAEAVSQPKEPKLSRVVNCEVDLRTDCELASPNSRLSYRVKPFLLTPHLRCDAHR